MEKVIIKFKLPMLENLRMINALVVIGYQETGRKFTVEFNGSKGYLSNVQIHCEGKQTEQNNIIWIENLLTKNGDLQSKTVTVYHSDENGVRVSV